jgi:3-methyl-2-oxobutanoate hydroxymethyltransferase
MGHIGMTPQSVNAFGGFRTQGRGDKGQAVVDAGKVVEEAGAFSVVLELIPAELAARITSELSIPTIGIGAGVQCDGQIQVFHDLVGLSPYAFRHAKKYAEGWSSFGDALKSYADEVRKSEFPASEHSV